MQEAPLKDQRRHVDGLIAALGETVGFPQLALEPDGACALSFDDIEVVIAYDEKSEALILTTILERVAEPPPAETMVRLMDLNAILFNRDVACINYNRKTQRITQAFRIDAPQTSSDRFVRWIERSLSRIEATRKAVHDALTDESDVAEDFGSELAFIRP